ncbi:MAG: hypothetical protein AAFP76_07230 [Bacteroidota bacterium]
MTIKQQLLPTLFLLFYFNPGHGQNKLKTERASNEISTSFLDRTEFKVAYSGSIFWNNGLNLGAEYLWKEYNITRNRKRGRRTNTHQFLLNGNLGFTTNFNTQTDTGLYTNFGLTWRRTNKKGRQFSIELNPLGYYRSFLPETYEVDGDRVNKVFLPGRGYYAPSLSVGIGKERKGKIRSGSYFNVNFTLRTPYNAGALPVFNLQYGFRFNFKKKK